MPVNASPSRIMQPDRLGGALSRLRAAARTAMVLHRLFTLAAAVVLIGLVLGLTDYLLRLPTWIRVLHWIAGIVALGWMVWWYVRPAWRFVPSLADIALRLERLNPEARGLLASAVDFAQRGDASRPPGPPALAEALAQSVVRRAERLWTERPVRHVLRLRPLLGRTLALVLACVVCLSVWVVSPDLWSIGFQRLALPWTAATWPKRTGVIDITSGDFHARGAALPLRAAVTRSNRPWDSTFVAVRYRLVHEGRPGEVRRELLTWQSRDADIPGGGRGALFERLIEPAADALDFRFETEDDQTEWRRLTLVAPPAVVSARAVITPPAYARALADGEDSAHAQPLRIDLGPGTDDRAVAPPVLAGSRIDLTISLNKPLPVPESVREVIIDPDAETPTDEPPTIVEHDGNWLLSFTLTETVRLPVRLRDEHGIESLDDVVYRFEAVADRPASATVTEPPADRTVLPSARVRAVAEGRDDVGLAWVALEQTVWTAAGTPEAPSGPGGALELRGDPLDIVRVETSGLILARAESEIDLATLSVKPGDEVRLVALAIDTHDLSLRRDAPTRSAPRTLRIISEAQFVEDVQRALAEVRQAAIRLEQEQQTLRERTESGRADAGARRSQAAITERLARQEENIARLVERLRENRFEDRAVDDLLGRSRGTINDAGRASSRAAQALEQADTGGAGQEPSPDAGVASHERKSEDGPTPPTASDPALRDAADAQQAVQDHLRSLIELLDRGEDNWIVRNTVERLLREQQQLRAGTQRAGQSTAGKSPEQLTPEERSELDRIVEKQSQLADAAAELARDMHRREEALRPNDPASAQGIARAARRAEESQLSQMMRNAASEASQNQTSRASRQQQQAIDALQQMLEDLDRVSKVRDDILRRQLASIIETLRGLVSSQEQELAALDHAIRNRLDLATLDAGLVQLNMNTLAASDQAKAAGAELAPVATLVLRAADAQAGAITEIRRPILGESMVREHETRSLSYLRQALERALQIDQAAADRQRRQRLAELKRAYRDLLERQASIRAETEPLAVAREPTRRERQIAAALSERQGAVALDLKHLLTQTRELQDARVFDYAHVRMDAQARRAADALADARARDALPPEDALLALLRHVLESLNDPKPDETRFAEGAGGGGGGGQGSGEQPLIPPLKELILLRRLQTDLAQRTIELSRAEAAAPSDLAELAEAQRQLAGVGQEFVERIKQRQAPAPPRVDPNLPQPPDPQEPLRQRPAPPFSVHLADQAPPTDEKPPPTPPDPLPDLDELLGLPKQKRAEPPKPIAGPAVPTPPPELERKLTAQELASKFEEAVVQMAESADRIGRLGDVGIPTQRLHEDILRKLDVLIKLSNSSSSSSSPSQASDQSSDPSSSPASQRPGASDQQAGSGDNRAERMPPAKTEAQRRARLDIARAAWGNLPERVRQSLLEGSSDYFSAMYEALTEAYYKKLAEEARE